MKTLLCTFLWVGCFYMREKERGNELKRSFFYFTVYNMGFPGWGSTFSKAGRKTGLEIPPWTQKREREREREREKATFLTPQMFATKQIGKEISLKGG